MSIKIDESLTEEKRKLTGCKRSGRRCAMRKRPGAKIFEREGLELRKRRRRNGRRKRSKGKRSGELVERKEVSREDYDLEPQAEQEEGMKKYTRSKKSGARAMGNEAREEREGSKNGQKEKDKKKKQKEKTDRWE